MKLGISALELHEEDHSMSWGFTSRAFASARIVLGLALIVKPLVQQPIRAGVAKP